MSKTIRFEQVNQNEDSSFTYRHHNVKPSEMIPYHQHSEWELSLLTAGWGQRMVGKVVESYQSPELVLLSPDVSHCWVCDPTCSNSENITIQFTTERIIDTLARFPELGFVGDFYQQMGICKIFSGDVVSQVWQLMTDMRTQNNMQRLLSLIEILSLLNSTQQYRIITIAPNQHIVPKGMKRMEKVIKHIMTHYMERISIDEIASVASLSPTAFCGFFKQTARCCFSSYLNDYRIGVASQLLKTTSLSISDICYQVGFNDVPHFNRTFKRLKGMPPSKYRAYENGR